MKKGLICLAILLLLLVACVALEAIDEGGCRLDCRRAGMEFGHYEFKPHHCWCLTGDGEEIRAY